MPSLRKWKHILYGNSIKKPVRIMDLILKYMGLNQIPHFKDVQKPGCLRHTYHNSFDKDTMLGYQLTAVSAVSSLRTRLTSRHSFPIILWFLLCSSNTLQWNETQWIADFILCFVPSHLCVHRRWLCDKQASLEDSEKENNLSVSFSNP